MSSTEAKQNFNSVISGLKDNPVSISKQDKEIAVILSSARYKELKKLEDTLYGKATELAIQEGFASNEETQKLFDSL